MQNRKYKLAQDVGKKIRDVRISNKLNQEAIANKLGISIPAYSEIETGQTDANISRVEQIAGVFDIDITTLFSNELPVEEIIEPLIAVAQKKVLLLDEEISMLQRKIIALYRELHNQGIDSK